LNVLRSSDTLAALAIDVPAHIKVADRHYILYELAPLFVQSSILDDVLRGSNFWGFLPIFWGSYLNSCGQLPPLQKIWYDWGCSSH